MSNNAAAGAFYVPNGFLISASLQGDQTAAPVLKVSLQVAGDHGAATGVLEWRPHHFAMQSASGLDRVCTYTSYEASEGFLQETFLDLLFTVGAEASH